MEVFISPDGHGLVGATEEGVVWGGRTNGFSRCARPRVKVPRRVPSRAWGGERVGASAGKPVGKGRRCTRYTYFGEGKILSNDEKKRSGRHLNSWGETLGGGWGLH